MNIINIADCPALKADAAAWFHEKWGIPEQAYLDSIEECISGSGEVPQWYLALEGGRMIAGMGVIENDFHSRKDLAPNVCAVFTEPEFRGRGIAGRLLSHVCADMEHRGIHTLYLITDHVGFYERYGWEFLCMVKSDDGTTRMYIHRGQP